MIPTVRPVSFYPTTGIHAVVTDWQTRVTAAGGTYAAKDTNALDTLIRSWESNGLIESGLTSGQVSASSIINFAVPCCGTNDAAARVPLLYRSGSGTSLTTGTGTPSYNSTSKQWSFSSGTLVSAYNPASYSSNNYNGFICARTPALIESGAVSGGYPYYGTASISGTSKLQIYVPAVDGKVYGDIYAGGANSLSGTITTSSTPFIWLANVYSGNSGATVTRALYQGSTALQTLSSAVGTVPSSNVGLPGGTATQPLTFFACSTNGFASGTQITNFVNAIESFRVAVI